MPFLSLTHLGAKTTTIPMSNIIYLGYYFKVQPVQPGVEILIAELGYAGFESFVETEEGVTAYIQKKDYHDKILNDIQILDSEEFDISFTSEEIEQVNWNQEWEKNFNPIIVDDKCSVRAPFHEKPDTEFDIIIEPKMSFGTGHHETTHMMIQHILKNDFEGKTVLDMGCGTGVLAILAEMKGAKPLDAIDFDNWCYLNSLENVERNSCKHITVVEGDASLLSGRHYDIVIANINRNILLNDIETYVKTLNEEGLLFLSGFYSEDIPIIKAECNKQDLVHVETLKRNNWVALKFKK
jgi:ribosomal protein L11 methyltransferase